MSHPTLNQYLYQSLRNNLLEDETLLTLLETIASSCVSISSSVRQGAINNILGSAQSNNIQGEVQQKLDLIANDIILHGCEWRGTLAGMASEEMTDPYLIPGVYPQGQYLLLFDPLDGSSNIDVNISVGTIFSILLKANKSSLNVNDFLQAGTKQIAAGYVLYGPQTMLVITFGHGTIGFTLDRNTGCFMLTHPVLNIPEKCTEFAINMSNQRHWELPVQRYINELLEGAAGPRGKNFNMRWVASMVAEVHRILIRGGIFSYPKDNRDATKPGKLRLMYEANPMAFLIEQAGGAATNGHQRILDIQPEKLHERVAVFLGAKEEVALVTEYHQK